MTKYRAVKTVVDGIKFDSKKEAAYYVKLKIDMASGAVKYFLRQVPFHLPGGKRYVCDFMVVDSEGQIEFTDIKGKITPVYALKKSIVEATYPIKIKEI